MKNLIEEARAWAKDDIVPEDLKALLLIMVKQLESDMERLEWLAALEEAGVDNWDGISFAHEIYEEANI